MAAAFQRQGQAGSVQLASASHIIEWDEPITSR